MVKSRKYRKSSNRVIILFFFAFAGEPTSNPELYSQVTCWEKSPYHGFNGYFCREDHLDQPSWSQAGRVPSLTGHNNLFDYLILHTNQTGKEKKTENHPLCFHKFFDLLFTLQNITQNLVKLLYKVWLKILSKKLCWKR